jgi:hypothetical protein
MGGEVEVAGVAGESGGRRRKEKQEASEKARARE